MFYPDYSRLQRESTHTASETAQPGYMLEISVDRAAALLDAAYLYVETNGRERFSVPSGKFSDAECALWELFLTAIRAGGNMGKGEL